MKSKICRTTMVFLVFSVVFVFNLAAFPAKEYKQITDLRGKTVTLPAEINRVVTIDDGLIEGIMTIIGESRKIVGLGSRSLRKTSAFTIPNVSGEDHVFKDGMNPVRYLNPGFADLPLIKNTTGINFEALATLKPDVVIIRVGSCSASWGTSSDAMEKAIRDCLTGHMNPIFNIEIIAPGAGWMPGMAAAAVSFAVRGSTMSPRSFLG